MLVTRLTPSGALDTGFGDGGESGLCGSPATVCDDGVKAAALARIALPDVAVVTSIGIEHTEGLDDEEVAIELRDHAWFVGFGVAGAIYLLLARGNRR